MRRERYISSMLFVIFAITTLCRISVVWLCGCEGHHHGETNVCNIVHSHDNTQERCQKQPAWGHCCGLHFGDLEYDVQTLLSQGKRDLSTSVIALLGGDYNLERDAKITLKESFFATISILSQWQKSPQRQRPPPQLV